MPRLNNKIKEKAAQIKCKTGTFTNCLVELKNDLIHQLKDEKVRAQIMRSPYFIGLVSFTVAVFLVFYFSGLLTMSSVETVITNKMEGMIQK